MGNYYADKYRGPQSVDPRSDASPLERQRSRPLLADDAPRAALPEKADNEDGGSYPSDEDLREATEKDAYVKAYLAERARPHHKNIRGRFGRTRESTMTNRALRAQEAQNGRSGLAYLRTPEERLDRIQQSHAETEAMSQIPGQTVKRFRNDLTGNRNVIDRPTGGTQYYENFGDGVEATEKGFTGLSPKQKLDARNAGTRAWLSEQGLSPASDAEIGGMWTRSPDGSRMISKGAGKAIQGKARSWMANRLRNVSGPAQQATQRQGAIRAGRQAGIRADFGAAASSLGYKDPFTM